MSTQKSLCQFFVQGSCNKGRNCKFKHSFPSREVRKKFLEESKSSVWPFSSVAYMTFGKNNFFSYDISPEEFQWLHKKLNSADCALLMNELNSGKDAVNAAVRSIFVNSVRSSVPAMPVDVHSIYLANSSAHNIVSTSDGSHVDMEVSRGTMGSFDNFRTTNEGPVATVVDNEKWKDLPEDERKAYEESDFIDFVPYNPPPS